MKKHPLLAFVFASLLLLCGCATGPDFTSVKDTLPVIPPGSGRVFVYRPSMLGAAIQPDVKLNGQVIGSAKSHGAFYADRAPGNYKVETTTEVTRELSFTLEAGQTRYVRLNSSMGFMVAHVYPELVDPKIGEKEIADCKFMSGAK